MEPRTPSGPPSAFADLLGRIEGRESVVGIIGLGYVGLPLAMAICETGFRVLGFDVDTAKVEALAAGRCPLDHLDAGQLATAVRSRRFEATADFQRLDVPDLLLICVPTPLGRDRKPDLSHVESTARQIGSRLRRGQLIVLESTTYPGTTEDVLLPILNASGSVCGHDFFLAYSPERQDPGNRDYETTGIPKIVGGVDRAAADLAEAFYRQVFRKIVRVSSAKLAEASKLTENIFRAVNIALVNELKVVYDGMGIDVWEVLDAAETKPFGFMRFNPGPGWGGHCIPVDPFYLSWKAGELGVEARFVELAGKINLEMPRYVISKLRAILEERQKPVAGSSILLLGVAYKPDIADPRESPAFELIRLLLDLGAAVRYHDPHVPVLPAMRSWPQLPPLESSPLDDRLLASQDAVIIVTHHSGIDYEQVLARAPLVVDTRGVYREPSPNLVRA